MKTAPFILIRQYQIKSLSFFLWLTALEERALKNMQWFSLMKKED
jgi:hypothetical protein